MLQDGADDPGHDEEEGHEAGEHGRAPEHTAPLAHGPRVRIQAKVLLEC